MVLGAPSRPSDLQVTGSLQVQSSIATAVQSVIKVKTYPQVVTNAAGSAPGSWHQPFVAGEFDQVFEVFAVGVGFSVTGEYGSSTPTGQQALGAIPQNVWVTVTAFDAGSASGQAFCALSDALNDVNGQVGFTVVVLGRKCL